MILRTIPLDASTAASNRPILGVVLHHTATPAVPFPVRGGSWHYCIGPDGALYRDVPEDRIAHHTGATDRWRPAWVVRAPNGLGVSDINYCSIGVEVTYAPQSGQVPTWAQEQACRELLADLTRDYGPIPSVGHGEVDLSKWPSEPHALDWQAIGCGPFVPGQGRYFIGDDMALTPEQQTILDSAARQTEAGNTVANGGDLDWWIGTWHQLAGDKESLRQLLEKSQQETAERDALIAQLQAQAAPGTVEVQGVTVTLNDGRSVDLTRN